MPTFNTTDPKPGYVYDSAIDTWFPLLGIAPASQVDRWTFTAVGGETSLTGNDDNAVSLSYTAGTEQVYLNGVLLVRGQDYTASNGTSITGLTALAASDIAEVVTFNPSNIITTDAVISTDFEAKGDIISASAASTPIRVPVGTNGHVLKANSATTSGLEWAASAADIEGVTAGTGLTGGGTSGTVTLALDSAAVIAPTIVDAKGDIIAATAADTVARLAVGTNGQYLAANSSTATGLEWQTVSSGGMTLISETSASALTSLTFNSLGSYKQLFLIYSGIRNSSNTTTFSIRLNNSSSGIYVMTGITSQNTSTRCDQPGVRDNIVGSGTNYDIFSFGSSNNNAASTTDLYGYLLIDNYTSTSKSKSYRGSCAYFDSLNSAYLYMDYNGIFNSTSAITSIDIVRTSGTGNFTNQNNTTIRLYGLQ